MARNEFIEMLENIFKGRGYEIITSSLDNSYMMLSKEGERTAVGFSPMGVSMTHGEAEMFLSMAENDSANDMLYIHPFKMKRKARAALKSGDVAMWDRTALAIAIGEAKIVELEEPEEGKNGAPGWFSGDEDPDPISEVREFEKQIKEEAEVTPGGFQVRKVTMGKDNNKSVDLSNPQGANETDVSSNLRGVNESVDSSYLRESIRSEGIHSGSDLEESVRSDDQGSAKEEDVGITPTEPGKDTGTTPMTDEVPPVSIEALDVDLSMVLEDSSVKELDVSPVFSLFDMAGAAAEGPDPSSGEKPPAEHTEDTKLAEWSRIPLAGKRISEAEATSLAGGDPPASVIAELRPHLLYSVRYVMETEDGASEFIQERPFLMDCTDGEVLDLPPSLAEELSNLKRSRPRNDKRPVITSRIDGRSAVENVRRKLMDLKMLRDEKVHDGPGSVIYEETGYTLRKGSLEVVGTFKVLMPYWVGTGENGDTLWAVEAYTGTLRHRR